MSQVIQDRAKTIKGLLEFIAEHRLLFTSTDFVNFLQTGYPEPEVASTSKASGVINAIRSSLHLPIEDTPPLEYQTDDDDSRSPSHSALAQTTDNARSAQNEADLISKIPIYLAVEEIRQSPKLSPANSFDSINSLASMNCDFYDEINKVTIDKHKPCVKTKTMLPDLIIFDAPTSSDCEDDSNYARSITNCSDSTSLKSNVCGSTSSVYEETHSASRLSLYSKQSVMSLSNLECKTKTEDSYVFEAGYMLNLAARCERLGDYHRAFECYKSGIEKMLIGVQ
ncbi:hypothetical protein ACJJTC_018927, partial [Scirpophaga incertulas]